MHFTEPVRQGRFLKRYKRFFADVELDGQVIVAHVPNTGSLKTCLYPGSACIVTESSNPERKLKATLHFLETPSGWAGVNTALPNTLVEEARGWLWPRLAAAQREYKISNETRLDLVLAPTAQDLEAKRNLHYVEVKNVTLVDGETARFPDAETTRGQKHLRELMALRGQGAGAEIIFVVQREGCTAFAPADDIDPEYGRLLREAHRAGVVIRAFTCAIDPHMGISLSAQELPLIL